MEPFDKLRACGLGGQEWPPYNVAVEVGPERGLERGKAWKVKVKAERVAQETTLEGELERGQRRRGIGALQCRFGGD